MLTVHPSIMLGSYIWDEERLPRDEFDIRMRHIENAMAANGWAGVIVYGDAREHTALAWFTNFIPRMRWAMALFSASGDRRILASISSRDVPAHRAMTMIDTVKSGWEWKWFDEWAAMLGDEGAIGVINQDQITPLLLEQMQTSLTDKHRLQAADDLVRAARQSHRPRELAVIREAAEIADAARSAFREAWKTGGDIENSALAAERAARELAVQDVRTLVSRDGGRTLEPFCASFGDRPNHLLGYVAVKYLGYWADSFVTMDAPAALTEVSCSALDSLISDFEKGAPLADMANGAIGKLGSMQAHPALSGNFGGRIGLSLREADIIQAGATGSPHAGTAYSLNAGVVDDALGGAITSTLVVRKADGSIETLLPAGAV